MALKIPSMLVAGVGVTNYDDSALKARVTELEQKTDNDTVYDDSALAARVTALEEKTDNDTVYDDTELAARVEALEEKTDNDTIYDDSELVAEIAKKTSTELTGTNGKALIFNENDGGGAKFEHSDGTWSGIAVNDGGANGIAGQLYVINSQNTAQGCKLNLEKDKFTYIKDKATSARTADDEIATLGSVKALIAELVKEEALKSE